MQGEEVQAFEEQFAAYLGVRHAVATNSGTAALHTALRALEVQNGDEVILPAMTFFACAAMVAACGARPVVVDVRPEDYNIDPDRMAEAVTTQTKGVMAVHLYGQAADLDPLREVTESHDLFLLEDACQAHGARVGGSAVGSLGAAGCFSFYPTKLITTGEGGMVVTGDEALASAARRFRNHGARRKYEHEILGFNYRMTDLAAAMGLAQLRKIDQFVAARREHAAFLTKGLSDVDGIVTPSVLPDRTHVFYQYVLRVTKEFPRSRDQVIQGLAERGVEARPCYPRPLQGQAAFDGMGRAMDCPVALALLPEMMELPVHPALSAEDLEKIVAAVNDLA